MQRRDFLRLSAVGALSSGAMMAAESESSNQYYELRFVECHNSKANQSARVSEFLEKHHLPMTRRLGLGPVGYFQVSLGADTPKLIVLTTYNSIAEVESKRAAMLADKEWMQAVEEFGAADQAPYDRQEVWLLRAFDGIPKLEAPPSGEKLSHHFDLRTYESETERDSLEKVRMFNTEEIKIFRRSGIHPVFFGKTLFGSKMPNLTYMVWYDDLDARAAAWAKFGGDADWKRIRAQPGWTDAEIVANVSNTFLRGLPFSPIR
jgi:NIPSNAP